MRRSSATVEPIASALRGIDRDVMLLSDADVAARIAVLAPLATELRLARLQGVIEQRIGSITVLLDSLHDPFNGAAVVRSCDVFGVARLHVIERHESFLAARSVSRGSEQWVEIATHTSGAAAVRRLEETGFELVAAHPEGTMVPADLAAWSEGKRVALVLGNEHEGIAEEVRARCDRAVRIPMRGFAESLNVSVTTAILLHELTRLRHGDLDPSERARLLLRGLVGSVGRARDILLASGLPLGA